MEPRPAAPLPADDPAALVEAVTARLHARGERMTKPRRAVLVALASGPRHATADDVVEAVAAQDATVHRSSVYRALEALSRLGVLQHVHLGHGATTYHVAQPDGGVLHLQCRRCGHVRGAPADLAADLAGRLAADYGFRLDSSHVALSGLCAACAVTAPR
nr:transcriptional repressor [Propionibacterium sp.]